MHIIGRKIVDTEFTEVLCRAAATGGRYTVSTDEKNFIVLDKTGVDYGDDFTSILDEEGLSQILEVVNGPESDGTMAIRLWLAFILPFRPDELAHFYSHSKDHIRTFRKALTLLGFRPRNPASVRVELDSNYGLEQYDDVW